MSTENKQVVPYPGPGMQRSQVVNRLNMLHFRGDPLLVIVRHREYGYTLTLKAIPAICHGDKLLATWTDTENLPRNLHIYQLEKIVIPGMATALELVTENVWLENDGLQAEIPARLESITGRRICRFAVDETIQARLTQQGISFEGQLCDFSPEGLRLDLRISGPQSFYWFKEDQEILLTLTRESRTFYSGRVVVLRQEGEVERKTVVVKPADQSTPRYQPKKERTKRFELNPSPDISFNHPLTGDCTTLSVRDMAVLGLSVRETTARSLLFPGLILENIELSIFGSRFLEFTGQVVYRRIEGTEVICGLAILDISVEDHYRLIGLAHRAEDNHAYVRLNQDPEKFFEFLFDTGFLYPAKYEEVHAHREAFIEAYKKLYLNPNRIGRCFVYQENNEIFGHVSALRIYRNTWLNHHHAAIGKRRSGLKVLRQISEFHTRSFVLNPLNMRYVVGIWRPVNDFPAKFFGKFAENLKNPSLCSMDTFTYMKSSVDTCRDWDGLQGTWEVAKATRQDISEFCGWYQKRSGGLLTQAFDLTLDTFNDQTVAEEYRAAGLKRERHIYAVRYGLDLKALVDVQDSDTGLNLSELTSAVYIYVLDEHMVTPKLLEFIQCMVAVKTQREANTVMLYPNTYVKRYQMEGKKEYTVWILNLNIEGTDAYIKHLSRYCR